MKFRAVLALPKTAGSAQTHKSRVSFELFGVLGIYNFAFNTKSSQIPRTFLWPFSQTFYLVYSPLNSAKLSCSSEVTLLGKRVED